MDTSSRMKMSGYRVFMNNASRTSSCARVNVVRSRRCFRLPPPATQTYALHSDGATPRGWTGRVPQSTDAKLFLRWNIFEFSRSTSFLPPPFPPALRPWTSVSAHTLDGYLKLNIDKCKYNAIVNQWDVVLTRKGGYHNSVPSSVTDYSLSLAEHTRSCDVITSTR